MSLGKSVAIFKNIDSDTYNLQEKGQAIYDICKMATHNSITKAEMLKVIWWLLNQIFDIKE